MRQRSVAGREKAIIVMKMECYNNPSGFIVTIKPVEVWHSLLRTFILSHIIDDAPDAPSSTLDFSAGDNKSISPGDFRQHEDVDNIVDNCGMNSAL